MIKCFIFDMDGTIANTLPLCIKAFRKSIGELSGIELTNRQITDTFGPSEEGVIASLLPNQYEEGIALYLKYYEALHPEMCPKIFHGIFELFSFAKRNGVKLAIVTGKGKRSLEVSMRVLEIPLEWFEHVEVGSSLGPNKPEGIARVLEALHVRPEEAVYIGDSVSDIHSSKEVLVPVVAAAWAGTANYEELLKYKPDYIFSSVTSMMEWAEDYYKKHPLL